MDSLILTATVLYSNFIPDSEAGAGSAGHQPGNIINHGFHLRRRLGLRN